MEYCISIHALLAESDFNSEILFRLLINFYPRSPCGERHFLPSTTPYWNIFLSTLSVRRATPSARYIAVLEHFSIQGLLAEIVLIWVYKFKRCKIFLSTLSLRRATQNNSLSWRVIPFLSTLSLRRATVKITEKPEERVDFYPRSPCGERPQRPERKAGSQEISIHALLAESDHIKS